MISVRKSPNIRSTTGRNPVALVAPQRFLILGAVIGAIDVADVMPVVAIGVRKQECRTVSVARALDELARRRIHRAHVLPVHFPRLDAEGLRTTEDLAG